MKELVLQQRKKANRWGQKLDECIRDALLILLVRVYPLQMDWVCREASCLDHHPSVVSVLISVQITMFSSSCCSAGVICVSRVSGQGDCSSLFLGLPLRDASQEGGAQLFQCPCPGEALTPAVRAGCSPVPC